MRREKDKPVPLLVVAEEEEGVWQEGEVSTVSMPAMSQWADREVLDEEARRRVEAVQSGEVLGLLEAELGVLDEGSMSMTIKSPTTNSTVLGREAC